MATIGNTYLSLIDYYKQLEGGEVTALIIEQLLQLNPILSDMRVVECNQGTTHLTSVRSGLPEPTWRELYQGVQPAKSTIKQVTDATGMLEAWAEIDRKLVDLSGNPAQFRLNEANAFLQGMANEMAETIIYGSAANEFTGLAPRFNSLAAENGGQIVDAGGTGAKLTSIWMVAWGDQTCHGLYPKGSNAGLMREDKGVETKTNSDGSLYDVVREKFSWDMGLTVRDWRYVVRIANIDIDELEAGNVDLYKFMRNGFFKMKSRRIPNGQVSIYCNTDIMEALDAQATNNGTTDNFVRLKPMELQGEEVLAYRSLPIREVDAIHNNEERVV